MVCFFSGYGDEAGEENFTSFVISLLRLVAGLPTLYFQVRNFAAWLQGTAQVTISGTPA